VFIAPLDHFDEGFDAGADIARGDHFVLGLDQQVRHALAFESLLDARVVEVVRFAELGHQDDHSLRAATADSLEQPFVPVGLRVDACRARRTPVAPDVPPGERQHRVADGRAVRVDDDVVVVVHQRPEHPTQPGHDAAL